RVGDSKPRHANVRFIAATNRNLEQESEAGRFRSDLYYRLSVFTISLPSLQDRKDDIPIFVKHFVRQFSLKINKPDPAVTNDFVKALQHHSWRGNIRELKNVIERSVILADDALDSSTLPSDFSTDNEGNQFELASMEKKHIRKVLAYTSGNKTQAAKLLDIGLTTLYQKIKDYNI
ncbi:MAG: sigma-54-dependent Fis family transcriptional regulator, partial [Marivirga sp.]|nr:sigma-54-dependent Fis family transcriptional regulator [Marivirga sp.]